MRCHTNAAGCHPCSVVTGLSASLQILLEKMAGVLGVSPFEVFSLTTSLGDVACEAGALLAKLLRSVLSSSGGDSGRAERSFEQHGVPCDPLAGLSCDESLLF